MSAKEVFRQFDSTGRGLLDASGLMSLFAVLLPALRDAELEALVAKWKAMSFSEVQKAMQWVTVKRAKAQKRLMDGGELPSFVSSSSTAASFTAPASAPARAAANWAIAKATATLSPDEPKSIAAVVELLAPQALKTPASPPPKKIAVQWPPPPPSPPASSTAPAAPSPAPAPVARASGEEATTSTASPKGSPKGGHSRRGSRAFGSGSALAASTTDDPNDGAMFMEALHTHMSRSGHTLKQLVDAFDVDRRGYLELEQLGPMVSLAFPHLPAAKHRYFQAMLSGSTTGRVTAVDVCRVADDCVSLDYDLRARGRVVLKDVLFKLCQFALVTASSVPQLVSRFDCAGRGAIETAEDASGMLREVIPGLAAEERTAMAAKWAAMSREELHNSMKWVAARVAKARKVTSSANGQEA
jgi:Ca2+-binding EF-hand superfamily protein